MTRNRIDPRDWALAWPRLTLTITLSFVAVMIYGNLVTRRGGLLDDPILDTTNVYRISDDYVLGKADAGFQGREYIPFILEFPGGIRSASDLGRIRDLTERVKASFGPAVQSLSEIPNYRDSGDELFDTPHVPEPLPPDFDLAVWKRRVAADPAVFGVFVGRNFDWAAILRYLPPGFDEIEEFRSTVEFLEDREIPWWEWLYKLDIYSAANVGVAGWVMARGLLDQGLNVDMFKLVSVGILLALPLFIWSLGSARQALIGVVGVVLMGLLWTRGSIGLLDAIGFGIRERVYTLVAYANCIVQGVSFVLHKFEAFNEMSESEASTDPASLWERARGNDHLIGATALIAIFGFITLYSFQVVSIRELGILSALAVAYQVFLATVFLPAVAVVFPGEGRARRTGGPSTVAASFQRQLERVAGASAALLTRSAPIRTAALAGGTTLLLALLATVLVWPGGYLLIKTEPLNFIRGTLVQRTGEFLNAPGRIGFDLPLFLVEPAEEQGDIYDPAFLASVSSYQQRLKDDLHVREVISIVDQVHRVSEETLHEPLPTSRAEASAVFGIIESNLNTAVSRQLFYKRGVRLTLSFAARDSVHMGEVVDGARRVALEEYPDLRVSAFGRFNRFSQVDRYIRYGKPLNLLTSQWVVILFCWLGIWLRSRRLRLRDSTILTIAPFWGGVIMSVPFIFATALMTLLMIAFGIALDAATAAVTALAINASIDFAIYYADAYQQGLAETGTHAKAVGFAMQHKGRIVLEDMLLNTVCFAPLVISRFEPIRDLGFIMMLMLPACAFGTVVLMPALFYLLIQAPAKPSPLLH